MPQFLRTISMLPILVTFGGQFVRLLYYNHQLSIVIYVAHHETKMAYKFWSSWLIIINIIIINNYHYHSMASKNQKRDWRIQMQRLIYSWIQIKWKWKRRRILGKRIQRIDQWLSLTSKCWLCSTEFSSRMHKPSLIIESLFGKIFPIFIPAQYFISNSLNNFLELFLLLKKKS